MLSRIVKYFGTLPNNGPKLFSVQSIPYRASLDDGARQIAKKCMQNIVLSEEFAHPHCRNNTFCKIVTINTGVEEIVETHLPTHDWLSAEETLSLLAENNDQKHSEKQNGTKFSVQMENLARELHEIADTLPYLGSSLDVIFCIKHPEKKETNSHSFVPVVGAFKRLVDWHNGCAVIVKSGTELFPVEILLADLGHCQVENSVDEINLHWPGWRGKVAVMDHIENKGHMFPAFWLECDNWDTLLQQKLPSIQQSCHKKPLKSTPDISLSQRVVCGRTIEVLQEVDLRTFPFFLLDSWTLSLHVQNCQSEVLVQYIQSLKQTGLLARLRIYPDSKIIPSCGTMNLNTVAWKDAVISNVQNLQEPQEEQVTADAVFLYFLLLPNTNISSASSPVVTKVLLTPHEINRNIFNILQDNVHTQKSGTSKNCSDEGENNTCDELILEQKDKFIMMMSLLRKNIKNVISEYQDGSAEGDDASLEILEATANIQTEIISAAFHKCVSLREFLQDSRRQQFRNDVKWVSEATLDPSKFPEKLALQAIEATRKMLQSFPSMDSLTATSPLSLAELEKKKDFDVGDIFQFFNRDGTLKSVPTCLVKMKGRGLCRVNSQSDPKNQWPDSNLFRFHDVYYYNNETDLGWDKRYSKVRDRGYFQDTQSSFISPIKNNQPTKSASSLSPVRWSQRRSTSSQHLMTSSRLDTLKRSSSKMQSVLDTTFKQPESHAYSPQTVSTPSSTPEFPQYSSKLFGHSSSDLRKIATDNAIRNNKNHNRSRSKEQTTPVLTESAARDHRKRSLTIVSDDLEMTYKRDKKHPVLAAPLSMDLSSPVRRSPRRSLGCQRESNNSSVNLMRKEQRVSAKFDDVKNNSFEQKLTTDTSGKSDADGQSSARMKRSERHKLKLRRIIDHVLKEKGIEERDKIHAACFRNLFNVSMVLLKTLTTSQNLTEEMKTVVYGQVTQIINLEKRRCGMTL